MFILSAPSCHYISDSLDLIRKSSPCPSCKAKNESRESYPPLIAEMIFVRIYDFYNGWKRLGYKSKGEKEIVVILTATLLEGLLNDFLINLLEKKEVSYRIAVIFIEKLGQIGNVYDKFNLFKEITNYGFYKSIKNVGYPEYYKNWEFVRKKRNEFMHAKTYILKNEVAEKAFELASESFSLFTKLNNKYCLRVNEEK